MKTIFKILIIFIFIGCESDNFYETKRIIVTDKNEYKIGDTIKLSLKIIPLKSEKKIRIYENYKNLQISFSLINEKTNFYNESWSDESGKNLPETKDSVFVITKQKPFLKTFSVPISSKNGNIILDIPDLKFRTEYDLEKIKNDTIRIHGFCNPINPEFCASLEEYFEVKDIKINVKK